MGEREQGAEYSLTEQNGRNKPTDRRTQKTPKPSKRASRRNAEFIDDYVLGKSHFNLIWDEIETTKKLIDKVVEEKLEWMQD